MGRFSKVLWAFVGLPAVAGLIATSASAEDVTLDILYPQVSFAKFHDPIAKEFMAKHPDIKIHFRAPAKDYDFGQQQILREAVTNQLPDVYFPSYNLLPELVDVLSKRKQINSLDGFLSKEPKDWVEDNYSKAILDLGKVNGKQFGMPINASLPIMYFNTELVKKGGGDPAKMPDTWDGVIALAGKIHAASPDSAGMSFDVEQWPDDWLFQASIRQDGGKILDSSGTKVEFGGPAGQHAVSLFRRFVTEGGMPLVGFEDSRASFAAGRTGIFFETPARLNQVTTTVGDKFTLGTSTFPIDNKADGGIPTGGSAAIIMTNDPAKQKAAWEYIKFMTGPEGQKIVVQTTGYLPTNKLATGPEYLGPFYEKNPNARTVAAQMERAKPWVSYPGGKSVQIWRKQREIVYSIMQGQIEPDAGLKQLVEETTRLMQ